MSTKLAGYDDTVICPYNKCHVILRHRIQTHLVKCARSHPDIILETCPFDVTHRILAEEMAVSETELSHLSKSNQRANSIFKYFFFSRLTRLNVHLVLTLIVSYVR